MIVSKPVKAKSPSQKQLLLGIIIGSGKDRYNITMNDVLKIATSYAPLRK